MSVNVTIAFRDNDNIMRVENVEIEQDMTRLILESPDGSYSVVPLAAVMFYDVKATG